MAKNTIEIPLNVTGSPVKKAEVAIATSIISAGVALIIGLISRRAYVRGVSDCVNATMEAFDNLNKNN